MRDIDLAYIAGFLDGEGYIGIINNHSKSKGGRNASYRLTVEICNTNMAVLEWILDAWCAGTITKDHHYKPNHKQAYRVRVGGKDSIPILEQLLPYLKIKKEQAEIALKFARTVGTTRRLSPDTLEYRESLRQDISKLNFRGLY